MGTAPDPAAARGGPWYDAAGRSRWHDHRGHSTVGNPGGPANPLAREMAYWRQRMRESVTPTLFDHVFSSLFALAIKGNLQAIKYFHECVCGRPERGVAAERLEAHELLLQLQAAGLIKRWDKAGSPLHLAAAPAPPPQGRPEAEWRRQEMPQRQAEAPAGVRKWDETLRGMVDAVRRSGEPGALLAMAGMFAEAADYARTAHSQTVADTRPPTAARRDGEGAPGGNGEARR